jgi:hypothetical protein
MRGASGVPALAWRNFYQVWFRLLNDFRAGMLAHLVLVDQNPLQNLMVLYGTGHPRLNDATGRIERVGAVRHRQPAVTTALTLRRS